MGVGDHLVATNRDFAISKGCFQRLRSSSCSASLDPLPETPGASLRAGKGPCPSPTHHLEISTVSSRVCGSTQAPPDPLRLRPRQEKARGPTHPTPMGRAVSPTSLATWLHGLGQGPGPLCLQRERAVGSPRLSGLWVFLLERGSESAEPLAHSAPNATPPQLPRVCPPRPSIRQRGTSATEASQMQSQALGCSGSPLQLLPL